MPPRSTKKKTLPASDPALDETVELELELVAPPTTDTKDRTTAAAAGEAPPDIPDVLPLVPIRDNVYFPHMIFPLFVGRDRSVKAVEAATEINHRYVLLAAQKQLLSEDPEPEEIYSVGIVAEVMQILKMPDNTVRVMLEGGARVRLGEFLQTEPYMLVRTEPLPESQNDAAGEPVSPIEVEALARTVTEQFERLVSEGKNIPPEALANVLNIAEPSRLADTVIPYLSLRVDQKQELLETLPVIERLRKLGVALLKEYEILDVQKNIRSRVEKEMGDNQREFILREQLKAIQQELGEMGERGDELEEYRAKIADAHMPEEIEARSLKELDRFEKTPLASPEAGVIRNYLDWLVSMPWDKRTDDTLLLSDAERILNEDHFGLEKVKERMLEFLAVRKLAGDALKSPILCFVGPPGVGKTSLGRSVSRALGRKFTRISLGGVRDEAEIRGHRRTYVGALPGRIIQALKQVQVNNPVILLDEIDKMGSDFRGDPSSALLEALDPEQNNSFSDHYLEVPFDLSNVLFVTTANLLDPIPAALRDRMEIISFSGYTEDEKVAIAEGYLVPKQVRENGLTDDLLGFEKESLRRLIREYTREAGVRNLEREIGAIGRKVARKVAAAADTENLTVAASEKTTIGVSDIKTYLGGRRFHWGVAEENDEVGSATGLVYTEVGGDTISIEVLLTKSANPSGEGRLLLTGQLGDVMKESAQTAWTFVRSRLASLGAPDDAVLGKDIHVHVPAGAVPKDGPSAGITLATALASAFTLRPIRKDVAMTGEITLRGKVLPIGGLKEKVIAAHRAGILHVIIPAENEKDLEEIPSNVRDEICFTLAAHADDVLKFALLEDVSLPDAV
jgi:ATP-dependent Lon protease